MVYPSQRGASPLVARPVRLVTLMLGNCFTPTAGVYAACVRVYGEKPAIVSGMVKLDAIHLKYLVRFTPKRAVLTRVGEIIQVSWNDPICFLKKYSSLKLGF